MSTEKTIKTHPLLIGQQNKSPIQKSYKNTTFNKFVGSRIKNARTEMNLTQQQVSDRMGFKSRQTLSNIENGICKVNAGQLVNFMKVLGQDLDYFTDRFNTDDIKIHWSKT